MQINKRFLDNATELKIKGTESSLYLHNKNIYKILRLFCRDYLREQCVDEMIKFKHPNCLFPDRKLTWKNTDEFIGVRMQYLEGFSTLHHYLNNNAIDFEKRKAFAYKMCEIINYLYSIGLFYIDIHASNVMTDGNELKLIDMDAAIFEKFYRECYRYDYEAIVKNQQLLISEFLAKICFSILLNYDLDVLKTNSHLLNELKNSGNRKQRKLLSAMFDEISKPICVSDYIEYFDESFMEDSKNILCLK